MIYLAFYKHRDIIGASSWVLSLFDGATRLCTRGKYSHCEIAIKRESGLYDCYSASPRDGGVRKKTMDLPASRWDLVEINVTEAQIKDYFDKTRGQKYDWLGALGLVLPFCQSRRRYFCSEWCFNAIYGGVDGWRFSPAQLACVAKL